MALELAKLPRLATGALAQPADADAARSPHRPRLDALGRQEVFRPGIIGETPRTAPSLFASTTR